MPVDPPRLNAVGDLVLTEPREFEALADPLRLTLFDTVRRLGSVTAATLAHSTGEGKAAVAAHLRVLESIGLVDRATSADGEPCWRPAARGIYFEIPDEPEGQRAARQLSNVMLARYATLPAVWADEQEPKLELEWARAAGLFNARVELTADELRGLQQELERLLEPLLTRSARELPDGAAAVRILAFFLPEAARATEPTG